MTTLARPAAADGDLPLTEADFARIARIAKAGWGLSLESAKQPLIRSRLGRRVKALGLAGFDAYCDLVETGDAQECDHFVTALTTNVTHFYREAHHFEILEQSILPPILSAARQGKRVRFWSAGCSTGQEAYSLAGSVLALAPDAGRLDLRILATDIDPTVLKTGQDAAYDPKICLFPTPALEERIFGRSTDDGGLRTVRPELRGLVTFRRLNLVQPWPISGRFDLIFCRNVVIYFDKPTQRQLWLRFAEVLNPGAWLLIGHSERIGDPAEAGLEPAGITTYRRTGAQPGKTSR
jgi:Methylase of chemotaxis methyl-accepting proteins